MSGPPAAGDGSLIAENPIRGTTGGPRLLITPTEPDATTRETARGTPSRRQVQYRRLSRTETPGRRLAYWEWENRRPRVAMGIGPHSTDSSPLLARSVTVVIGTSH